MLLNYVHHQWEPFQDLQRKNESLAREALRKETEVIVLQQEVRESTSRLVEAGRCGHALAVQYREVEKTMDSGAQPAKKYNRLCAKSRKYNMGQKQTIHAEANAGNTSGTPSAAASMW